MSASTSHVASTIGTPRGSVAVVLCTRNPAVDRFQRVIVALSTQSLPAERWKLLIVDNSSSPPVATPELRGLPACQVLVEKQIGLTPARLCGIAAAEGELIVFVDDDHILDGDYLSEAVALMERRPDLGAWSACVRPEFESPPPEWIRPFWAHLALSVIDHNAWSNRPYPDDVLPVGAGLCIRRNLACTYAEQVRRDPRRQSLDRKDGSTAGAGDTDMALTCIDNAFATGRFSALKMTHLIPASRLEFGYQRRLARGLGESYGRLLTLRGGIPLQSRLGVWSRTLKAWLGLAYRGKERTLDLDYHRGFLAGLAGRGKE